MRTVQIVHVICVTGAAVALSAGCNAPRGDAAAAETAGRDSLHSDSAGGLVVAPTTRYVTTSGGRAAIVISLPADSTDKAVRPDTSSCGIASSAQPASDAVVWIEGIREGKPLPEDRRYELISAGCGLTPRVQGVVVGGTIDVVNDDAVIHRLIFLRAGTNDTLQTMPFTNDGEVVATERLTKTPGIIEVRCAEHPQERAYIGVFDHPYFGIGSAGKPVTLDSIPPGNYRVFAWREGMAAPTAVATRVGPQGRTQVVVPQ
jgi:hypothetical protein